MLLQLIQIQDCGDQPGKQISKYMKGENADDEICIWDVFMMLEAVWKEILALQASY